MKDPKEIARKVADKFAQDAIKAFNESGGLAGYLGDGYAGYGLARIGEDGTIEHIPSADWLAPPPKND